MVSNWRVASVDKDRLSASRRDGKLVFVDDRKVLELHRHGSNAFLRRQCDDSLGLPLLDGLPRRHTVQTAMI
jgi:hypothetical protein